MSARLIVTGYCPATSKARKLEWMVPVFYERQADERFKYIYRISCKLL